MDIDDKLLAILMDLRLRKAQALLLFLLSDANRPHRTEKLLDLFWQTSDQEKAAVSCRQVVRKIRLGLACLPDVKLESGNGQMLLSLLAAQPLLDRLVGGLSRNAWPKARAECLRGYLALFEALAGISPSFDSWLVMTRSALLSSARRIIDAALSGAAPSDSESLLIAEFALEIEPSNEVAARFVMIHHWRAGRATRAIEVYNALYAHLDAQFDQEPEPETVSLLAAIKLDPGRAPERAFGLLRPQVSIAVIPYDEPGRSPEAAALANALQADLRLRLGRFREWRVVGDQDSGTAELSLHLRPFLTGAQPRLFLELLEGWNGRILWSECLHAPASNWENKIRPVLINIANALSVVVADRALSDPAAGVYDRWLRSQVLLDTWSPRTEGQALAMLRDITREAPRFGPAHAELAGALNVRHVLLPGTRQTDEVKQLALHHALEALSIDPLDTRAHRVLAWCYCHKGEFGLAEFHFEQALSLNPTSQLTLVSAALGFAFTGNVAQAGDLARQARQLGAASDAYHRIYMAATDYLCGNYKDAAEQCRIGAGLMSTVGGWHSASLWKLGRVQESRERLADWTQEIAQAWHMTDPPSQAQVIDWFTASFPLRHSQMRDDLHATLSRVACSEAGMTV